MLNKILVNDKVNIKIKKKFKSLIEIKYKNCVKFSYIITRYVKH